MIKLKISRVISILSASILLASMTGCSSKEDSGLVSESNSSNSSNSLASIGSISETSKSTPLQNGTGIIKDRSGKEVKIPNSIDSIISLAPAITEVLVDIGVGDKLVGLDSQSALCQGVPGGLVEFDMTMPDAEKITAMNPSVVLTNTLSYGGADNPFKVVEDLGIAVVMVPTSESIDDIEEDIQFIADVVSKSKEGKKLVDDMEKAVDKIEAIGDTIPDNQEKTVLFEIAAAPSIYSFGSDVFLNEMIEIIGAENVLHEQEGWLPVEAEFAVSANPDVILTNVNYIEDPVAEILSREAFVNVTAVKQKAVYYIDNVSSSLPNHNIVKALEQMAKSVYPEKY